tara:strand:+ start:388 stop:612 length:225 start_codon:yes stop_codon:yes gene_type:complete
MAMKAKDKTVKVLKETPHEYAVMVMGQRVGVILKLRQDKWQLKMDDDPPGRNRRPFVSLRVARSHVLAMTLGVS